MTIWSLIDHHRISVRLTVSGSSVLGGFLTLNLSGWGARLRKGSVFWPVSQFLAVELPRTRHVPNQLWSCNSCPSRRWALPYTSRFEVWRFLDAWILLNCASSLDCMERSVWQAWSRLFSHSWMEKTSTVWILEGAPCSTTWVHHKQHI